MSVRVASTALRRPAPDREMEAGRARARVAAAHREHGPALFRYLVRSTSDPQMAEDVFQDTFLRLLERPPRHDDNLRGWLFRVATNRLRDLGRARARQARLTGRETGRRTHSDPPRDPGEAALAADAASRVRDALRKLPVRDRTLLVMREEGFAHREIAEALGTTTGSVGTLIARALRKLAKELEARDG